MPLRRQPHAPAARWAACAPTAAGRVRATATRLNLVVGALVAALLVLAAIGTTNASAAVTYRSSSSDADSQFAFTCAFGPYATAAVPVPSGTVTGDVMIATVSAAGAGGQNPPAGWTQLARNTSSQDQSVYLRVRAAGDPGSYSWTAASGFCGQSTIAATIDTYTGVDPTEPITAGAGTALSGAAALPMPSDTAVEAGSMRISSAAAYRNNSTAMTTGWSTLTPRGARNMTGGGGSVSVGSASIAQDAGPTSAATATLNQAPSAALAFTAVLRPDHVQKLGFTTQPVGGVAEGVSLATQPAVALQNGNGSTATAETADVTLSKAGGPAAGVLSCSGGLTRTTVAGIASFTGCQITGTQAAGTYTIRATSPGLADGTSSTFTIVAGPAAKLDFTTQPTGGVAENVAFPTQPSVTVRDAYDNVATGDTGPVTIAVETGPASGTVTGCAANPRSAVSGVAAFSGCRITGTAAAGTYTLRATRSGLTSDTSASFTIVAGAANRLAFSVDPGDAPAGVDLSPQPQVAIQDAYGNTVTGSSATVTLSKASGPAAGVLTCSGGLSKAASGGIATFSGCRMTGTAAIGTYTLSATGSVTAATSASFVITAGAAARLVFTTQPVGGVAEGVSLPTQPAVAVQDAYGNLVTGSTADVTLDVASGPAAGVVGCPTNPRPASSGIATFAGCAITGSAAAGTYTLRATGTGLTAGVSSSFTIVVGPAAKVAFTTQPVGGVAEGVNLPTQPAVSVQDAYGNGVTGSSATITLSIASGPATGVLSCTGGLGRAASAGTATFAGCRITGTAAVGTYTATATAAGLTSDTSATFVIVTGAPAVVVFTTQPVGDVPEGTALPTQPVARVRDAYGNTVTSSSATITLSIAGGPASGALNCVGGASRAAVSGVATFSGCQIIGTAAAGTYTLRAASGALTPDTSSSFEITPGTPTRLTITTQPVGGVPEATDLPTQPQVTVQDAFANTVTSATTPVTLGIASGPASGVLGCAPNPRSATAGVATFAGCQITGAAAAGTYTLNASGGGLAPDTSAAFTITSGPAARLAFTTQPVGGVSPGSPLPTQPTVATVDAHDNPVTTGSPTIGLAVGSGPGGSLACTPATATATGGSATFAGCRIQGVPGTYTLTATSGSLTPATSDGFVITAGSLTVSSDDYAYPGVSITGLDQTSTSTLPIHVTDTTGAGTGWRISASATPWVGGTLGTLTAAQRVAAPPTATCDGGPGSCTPAVTGIASWPIPLSTSPAVIYDAAAGTGAGAQTIAFPMSLPLTGNLTTWGSFSQQVTVTVAAAP